MQEAACASIIALPECGFCFGLVLCHHDGRLSCRLLCYIPCCSTCASFSSPSNIVRCTWDFQPYTMANNNSKTTKCQICHKSFRLVTPVASVCQACQKKSPTSSQRPSTQASDNSIPAAYLSLLDSRIADLEHAAEASRSSDQSAGNNANGTDRLARPDLAKSPYITDGRSRSQRQSPYDSKSNSIVMERFLKDASEPDGV